MAKRKIDGAAIAKYLKKHPHVMEKELAEKYHVSVSTISKAYRENSRDDKPRPRADGQ